MNDEDEWSKLARKSEKLQAEIERLARQQEAILKEMAKLDEEARTLSDKKRGST